MEKIRHTPGPWKIEQSTKEYALGSETVYFVRTAAINSYGDKPVIAAPLYVDSSYMDDDVAISSDCPQNIANMQLIATSPELLDALRPVYQEISNRHHYPDLFNDRDIANIACPLNDDYPLEITISVKEARAIIRAIKKSGGE